MYLQNTGITSFQMDIKGNNTNQDIMDNVNKLSNIDKLELLNSLFSLDEELYSNAIKIFQNTATKEEFSNFTEKLEKNWNYEI